MRAALRLQKRLHVYIQQRHNLGCPLKSVGAAGRLQCKVGTLSPPVSPPKNVQQSALDAGGKKKVSSGSETWPEVIITHAILFFFFSPFPFPFRTLWTLTCGCRPLKQVHRTKEAVGAWRPMRHGGEGTARKHLEMQEETFQTGRCSP